MVHTFSQQFIQDRKNQLLEEKESLVEEIAVLKKDDPFADPDHAIDNAAVDTDVREQTDHQVIEAEVALLERRLSDIEIALEKIEKGIYGYDENTGEAIPEERLKLVPEARVTVKKGE